LAGIESKREIRRAVDTGKAIFGKRECEKSILSGGVQLIVFTSSVSKSEKERLAHYCKTAGIPKFEFKGSSQELGAVCGKVFVVSVMGIIDAGKSKVLELEEKS